MKSVGKPSATQLRGRKVRLPSSFSRPGHNTHFALTHVTRYRNGQINCLDCPFVGFRHSLSFFLCFAAFLFHELYGIHINIAHFRFICFFFFALSFCHLEWVQYTGQTIQNVGPVLALLQYLPHTITAHPMKASINSTREIFIICALFLLVIFLGRDSVTGTFRTLPSSVSNLLMLFCCYLKCEGFAKCVLRSRDPDLN